MLNRNNIEYIGLNIFNGKVLNKKIYFHYDKMPDLIPEDIGALLKPFDYGKREKGYSFSISAFIPDCSIQKINLLIDFAVEKCGIRIDREWLVDSFNSIAMLDSNYHYDPVVSFKFDGTKISGISFYVTALKDKSLMLYYLNVALNKLKLNSVPGLSTLMLDCVTRRFADMYLVSWDFDLNCLVQNKIYLKVKDRNSFINECKKAFPYLDKFTEIESYRFTELAFAFSDNNLKMLNLYFKPL